jgi:hypothetical protein
MRLRLIVVAGALCMVAPVAQADCRDSCKYVQQWCQSTCGGTLQCSVRCSKEWVACIGQCRKAEDSRKEKHRTR